MSWILIFLLLFSVPGLILLAIILKVLKKKRWYWPLLFLALLLLVNGIGSIVVRTDGDVGNFYDEKQEVFDRNSNLFTSIINDVDGGVAVCDDHTTNADVFSEEQIGQIRKDIEELHMDCIVLDTTEEIVDFRKIGWDNSGYYYLRYPERYADFIDNDDEKRINERWVRYR